MATYSQIPVRLQVQLTSNPPVGLLDVNTGMQPSFWQASDTSIAIGIFDASGVAVDLSNLTSLQLTLQQNQTSVTPLATSQVLAASITASVSQSDWQNGLSQQAVIAFTAAQMDQGLGGNTSAQFWMVLSGQTASTSIVYAAGWVTIHKAGFSLPFTPTGNVSLHQSSNDTGNLTVTPLSFDHTEVITVGGSARISNLILATAGMVSGARLHLQIIMPATAGIDLELLNGDLSGANLGRVDSDQTAQQVFVFYFNETDSSWHLLWTVSSTQTGNQVFLTIGDGQTQLTTGDNATLLTLA